MHEKYTDRVSKIMIKQTTPTHREWVQLKKKRIFKAEIVNVFTKNNNAVLKHTHKNWKKLKKKNYYINTIHTFALSTFIWKIKLNILRNVQFESKSG
jgi:hypothetical protein